MSWPPRIIDSRTDNDHFIAATANLLMAQLRDVRRLATPSGQRSEIRLRRSSTYVPKYSYQVDPLHEAAEEALAWAEDFDTTANLLGLLGLCDDAIEAYRRQVRESAEAALREVTCQ